MAAEKGRAAAEALTERERVTIISEIRAMRRVDNLAKLILDSTETKGT